MATTTSSPQEAVAPPKTPGLIKRIILIVLIILIAAGVAAAGVWLFMSQQQSTTGAAGKVRAASAPAPLSVPAFFPLDPMTVNLQSDDGQQHYLRIGLTLKLTDEKTQEHLAAHMPEIRSRVLLALSNKHPEELAPLDGKHALATELKTRIEQPTEAGGQPATVQAVPLPEFVIQ